MKTNQNEILAFAAAMGEQKIKSLKKNYGLTASELLFIFKLHQKNKHSKRLNTIFKEL